MKPAVVMRFSVAAEGPTRDGVIDRLDGLGSEIIALVGGEPWVMVDDDIRRVHNPGLTLADDQGFYYVGVRTYSFNGPFRGDMSVPMRDGFRVQDGVSDVD